jgi:DNA-binding PadR family transcriptional regulator
MARRRAGELIPIEEQILEAGLEFQRREGAFHGFALAKAMAHRADSKSLIGHGTLYKALGRLADRGLLTDEWEDPEAAAADGGRPRRRLYRVTGAGEVALTRARAAPPSRARLGGPIPHSFGAGSL